jgi:hypothetical protein
MTTPSGNNYRSNINNSGVSPGALILAEKRLDQCTITHKYNKLMVEYNKKEEAYKNNCDLLASLKQKLHYEVSKSTRPGQMLDKLNKSLIDEQYITTKLREQLNNQLTNEALTIDNLTKSIKTQHDIISQLNKQLKSDAQTIDALSRSLKAEQCNYSQLKDQLKQHLTSDALIIDTLTNSVKTEQLVNIQLKQQLKRHTTSDKLVVPSPPTASISSDDTSCITKLISDQLSSDQLTINTLQKSLISEQEINTQLRQQLTSDQSTIDTLRKTLKDEQTKNYKLADQSINNSATTIETLKNDVKRNQHVIARLNEQFTNKCTSSIYAIDKLKQSLTTEQSINAKLLASLEHAPLDHYNINSHKITNTKLNGIFGELHKKNIKKIRNVYQTEYVNDKPPTGLGDFIRGCYFLLHFCQDYNFEPEFYINHPIKSFTQDKAINGINKASVHNIAILNNFDSGIFDPNNYIISHVQHQPDIHEFIEIVNTLPVDNGCINLLTILFPYRDVVDRDKVVMKKLLMPNEQMEFSVNDTLRCIKLTKQQYSVIHIRLGDDYLIKNEKDISSEKLTQLTSDVRNIIAANTDDLLLLCDNNTIKRLLCNQFTQLKEIGFKINHFGENVVQTNDEVQNNLTDFYLMANSNAIHAFSCYNHGTGFSRWCAKTYDIPYSCKYIG